jgi:hypothetical protein
VGCLAITSWSSLFTLMLPRQYWSMAIYMARSQSAAEYDKVALLVWHYITYAYNHSLTF